MKRKIIKIDADACNGCGLCVNACHEGAIGLVEGKATLLRDDYCDGLGDCLPVCPTGAITFEEREAAAFDKEAVLQNQQRKESELSHWPVQIRLVAPQAPCFDGADVLIAADCTAFTYANFHKDFMQGRTTIIGCPKLDDFDYAEKLAAVFQNNDIRTVTLARMEVPCCSGMQRAIQLALQKAGKDIPFTTYIIATDGTIKQEEIEGRCFQIG